MVIAWEPKTLRVRSDEFQTSRVISEAIFPLTCVKRYSDTTVTFFFVTYWLWTANQKSGVYRVPFIRDSAEAFVGV
jgi:hypothetical protein